MLASVEKIGVHLSKLSYASSLLKLTMNYKMKVYWKINFAAL